MEVKIKGRVTDIRPGDDVNFVTMSDIDEGGMFKLMIPSTVEVKLDALLNLACVVKASLGKFGLNMRFIRNLGKE